MSALDGWGLVLGTALLFGAVSMAALGNLRAGLADRWRQVRAEVRASRPLERQP